MPCLSERERDIISIFCKGLYNFFFFQTNVNHPRGVVHCLTKDVFTIFGFAYVVYKITLSRSVIFQFLFKTRLKF